MQVFVLCWYLFCNINVMYVFYISNINVCVSYIGGKECIHEEWKPYSLNYAYFRDMVMF